MNTRPPPPFRLPAEFEPQRSLWMTWPGNPATWPSSRADLEPAYSHFAATVSRFQSVDLICSGKWQPRARALLSDAQAEVDRISFHDWPVNDAWCRDHGPLFVKTPSGGLEIIDFRYNAWGGKYPWELDDCIPERVSELRNFPHHRVPIFGEGGAIEINRQGLLLTTESVWLNPNRNPGHSRNDIERLFDEFLGATRTIWLKEGLQGDDTDGHIDMLTRFVSDDTVVTAVSGRQDPDFGVLHTNRMQLEEVLNVVALPQPSPVRTPTPCVASYANFIILNEAVLVPTYAQPESDDRALGILRELFTGRKVTGIPACEFIREGGALHCLCMQEPA